MIATLAVLACCFAAETSAQELVKETAQQTAAGEQAPSESQPQLPDPTLSPANSDESTADESTADESTADESPPDAALSLPLRHRDGRPFRPIGIYQSQLVDLVPQSFRVVSIGELRQAIENDTERFADAEQTRLVSGFYDVRLDDQLLISEHSELVIEHPAARTVFQSLGPVNVAILDSLGPTRAADPNVPHLEVDSQGELIAVIPASAPEDLPDDQTDAVDAAATNGRSVDDSLRSKIQFAWTLQSQTQGKLKKFELRLPRTPQTRLIITTPSDTQLESAQGVLVERPGPPPGADLDNRTGDIRWYVLEAGGLNRIEIYAKKITEGESNDPVVVRRESKQYEVDLSGVTWTHRMTIELPELSNTVRLLSPQGTVTAVRVNSVRTPYQVLRRTDGQSLVDVELPNNVVREFVTSTPGANAPASRETTGVDLVTLTVTGDSSWDISDGRCELPSVTVVAPNVLWTEASTQTVVAVMAPLVVAQWEIPPTWRQAIQSPTRAGETLLIAEGPSYDNANSDPIWSRLKLVQQEPVLFDEIWLRLQIEQSPTNSLSAKARLRCRIQPGEQSPLQVDVNPDWTIDSVTVVGSGRQITPQAGTSQLTVWPTASEVAQSSLVLEIAGKQSLQSDRKRVQVPETWFIRPRARETSHVIAMQPPRLRRWDGESVMLQGRIKATELDEAAVAFLQPNSETLLLRSPDGSAPAVALEPIDSSLGVSLRLNVETDGDEVSETIVVRAETSQPISELTVLTGNSEKPAFQWSLRRLDRSATVSVPESSVTQSPNDPLGKYVIQMDGRDFGDYELVAQRSFQASEQFSLPLPSVRDAISQNAEVFIDRNWKLPTVPQSVQLVPGYTPTDALLRSADQAQHLRYDPLMRPVLRLQRTQPSSANCLIWTQTLEVTASSRSEDLFQLFAEVSAEKAFRLSFDPELEFISLVRNGHAQRPTRTALGELWIEPEKQSDQIAVVFRRRHTSTGWLRRCNIPEISIGGHVIQSGQIFQPDADTFLIHSQATDPDSHPGARALYLVPRNIALALGWLIAAILFCLAWAVARWCSLGAHALFVIALLSVSASVIWWPWQVAILGWVAVPVVLGGLLQSVARAATRVRRQTEPASDPLADDTRSQKRVRRQNGSDLSGEFSISSVPRGVLFITMAVVAGAGPAIAQNVTVDDGRRESESRSTVRPTTDAAIDLLVPLDQNHQPVGDKIYLSQSDYQSITDAVDPERPVDARFHSAQYRVVLSQSRDAAPMIDAEIQADYQIHLARQATNVRLPVRAETLRRIELLSNNESQITRFTVDDRGFVTVAIPPSEQVRLRITFVPTILAVGGDTTPTAAPTETPASSGTDDNQSSSGDSAVNDGTGPSDSGANPAASDGFDTETVDDRMTLVRLGIPAIHSANLVVEAPREIVVDSLGNPLGRSSYRADLGRYEADLGPISELAIQCRPLKRNGLPRSSSLRRAYRIAAGIQTTVVECELTPSLRMSEGESIQLTVLGPPPTSLTSSGWVMIQPTTAETSRESNGFATDSSRSGQSGGVYRFEKQSSAEDPIRLMWRLPSLLNDPTSTRDSRTMPIPEVFSSVAMRAAPTLFAIESAASIRVSELASESKATSIDEFLNAWQGFPGRQKIERAFIAKDEFPSFVLLQDKYPEPTIKLEHQLHVRRSHRELRLRAEIVDLRPSVKRVLVSMPASFRLVKCVINGEPSTAYTVMPTSSESANQQTELLLGDQRVDGTTSIELIAQSELPGPAVFRLPRFQLSADGVMTETYRLTRERGLNLELVPSSDSGSPAIASHWQPAKMTQSDLLAGRIPVLKSLPDQHSADEDAQRLPSWYGDGVRVTRLSGGASFACDQTSVMRYSNGRWACDTLIRFPGKRSADFVDIQIPTRWATDLTVNGAAMWVKRESSDAVISVIRIALPPTTAGEDRDPDSSHVVVTGNLDNRDQIRVSVPAVSVLGQGRRDQVIAVPNQLTTESIQWRRQAVSPQSPDDHWFVPFGNRISSPQSYSLYAIDGNNWSIELEPLSQAEVDPVALSCDVRVYLNADHALVYQRFDLLPETRDEVTVSLPASSNCIGVWSAGREIELQSAGDAAKTHPASASKALRSLRVPLTYSRLPQSLEILIEVAVVDRRIEDYLAIIDGIPTQDTWLAYYQLPVNDQTRRLKLVNPEDADADSAKKMHSRQADRLFGLARSVVTAVDRSRDMLAERSNEEIESWLLPWISRYRSLASAGGHHFQATPREEEPDPSPSLSQQRWQALDQQLLELAGRFLQQQPSLPTPLFSVFRFSEYKLVDVAHFDPGTALPVLDQNFSPRKSLQRLLLNSITLLMFAVAIVLLWPFRGRFKGWIHEPAVWLFLIGFLGLFLIPIPLAVTLIIVAVTVPLINRRQFKTV
ncbi:hypothetical protein [Stieleria tagensis]|uniref:hypothetical protein n=1 Tax=Stieleria tagensis TaxID=2956795 RepID=UPI00209B4D0B|nr:hypothetical protein [Stieleria tagensis]